MFFNSKFSDKDVSSEKGVIYEEIDMYEDTPDDLVTERLIEGIYQGCALSMPILGSRESLSQMDGNSLRDFKERNYNPNRIVVALSGSFEDTHIDYIKSVFGSMAGGEARIPAPAEYAPVFTVKDKPIEQNHLCLAFPGLPIASEHRYTMQLLSSILGGGMSSRLFQEVREKRGLAYSIHSFAHGYRDCGLFGIYAGTGEQEASELVPVLCDETMRLEQGFTPVELARAKAQIKAGLLMSLESTSARCEQMAQHMLIHGTPFDPADIVCKIEAVDDAAIRRVVSRWLTAPPTVAALGPVSRLEDFDRLKTRLAA